MIIRRTDRGDKALRKLDPPLRLAAKEAIKSFCADSARRGLNFEKLQGYDNLYSIRINRSHRIILGRTDVADTYEIIRIGPHDSYRHLPGGDD